MERMEKEEVKKVVENFPFIDKVSKVNTNKKILGDNAVELDLWANKPAAEIREEMMEFLKQKYPKKKFNLVFFVNINNPYQNN